MSQNLSGYEDFALTMGMNSPSASGSLALLYCDNMFESDCWKLCLICHLNYTDEGIVVEAKEIPASGVRQLDDNMC